MDLATVMLRLILISVLAFHLSILLHTWTDGFKWRGGSICADENVCLCWFAGNGTSSQMEFIAYESNKTMTRGIPFPCSLKQYLGEWRISDRFNYTMKPIEASKVVFVSYSSSNHFKEARRGIYAMRAAFKNKIIFYDLGLQDNEVKELHNVCNLEVRKFHFEKYPYFVSRLYGFHFKPIIMAEVFSEFENYWIVDSSFRFNNVTPNLDNFYENITKGAIEPLVLIRPTQHSIYAATHPRMFEYLPMSIKLARRNVMLAAQMFISRSEMSREAIKWNVLCALTKGCMSPTKNNRCSFGNDSYRRYAKCHRFDQSSLNIIVSSLMERDGWKRRDQLNDNSITNFTETRRGEVQITKLSIPCDHVSNTNK